MTYHVLYGDAVAMTGPEPHVDERVCAERFSTEHEALRRARELLEEDISAAVAISDAAGNMLSGVRLQLRLGYAHD
jgi:hypothetical protein